MINIYQGETLYVDVTIINEAGEELSLTDFEGVLAYSKSGVTSQVDCTIVGSVMTGKLTNEITAALSAGEYTLEMKAYDSSGGDIGVVLIEQMQVETSVIPSYDPA